MNTITLSQEQIATLQNILNETPFKYAAPIFNLLNQAAQDQSKKDNTLEETK